MSVTILVFTHAGSYLHPPFGGGTPPIDVNTHPQTVLPQWGCVYTVLVVYSYTAYRILGISLLGDPNILSVLVCLVSVCIIMRILKQCFIAVRYYP